MTILSVLHRIPMLRSKACRFSAEQAKEIHVEDKRSAVWIVKENYAPITEKDAGLSFGSQAAEL